MSRQAGDKSGLNVPLSKMHCEVAHANTRLKHDRDGLTHEVRFAEFRLVFVNESSDDDVCDRLQMHNLQCVLCEARGRGWTRRRRRPFEAGNQFVALAEVKPSFRLSLVIIAEEKNESQPPECTWTADTTTVTQKETERRRTTDRHCDAILLRPHDFEGRNWDWMTTTWKGAVHNKGDLLASYNLIRAEKSFKRWRFLSLVLISGLVMRISHISTASFSIPTQIMDLHL